VVRSARSWLRHSHASLTHIASRRVAPQRFLGGLQRQLPGTLCEMVLEYVFGNLIKIKKKLKIISNIY
jgi:hypothetical protein